MRAPGCGAKLWMFCCFCETAIVWWPAVDVIPVPENISGSQYLTVDCYSCPSPRLSAFHEFQDFSTPTFSRHQRCGCDHRRFLLLPGIAKAPPVHFSTSSLPPSTAATFTTQRSSRPILLVSAPIRPQEHALQISQQLQLSRPFLHCLSYFKITF
jgi:hypothetical protein